MRAPHPAQVLHGVVIVLILRLVRLWCRAELKSRGQESKFVDTAGQIIRRPVDPRVGNRDRVHVACRVIDVHQPKAKIIDQPRRKNMRLRDDEYPVMNRKLVGEVQVGSACRRAQRGLQASGPERNVLLGIGVEEARRH